MMSRKKSDRVGELPLFASDGRVHHRPLTDGLNSGPGHDGHTLTCPRFDVHRDEHAKAEVAAHRVALPVVDRGGSIAAAGQLATDVIVLDDGSAGSDVSAGGQGAGDRVPAEMHAPFIAVRGHGTVDDIGRAGQPIIADQDEVHIGS